MQLLHPWQDSAVQILTYVRNARGSKIPRTRNFAQRAKEDRVHHTEDMVYKVLKVVSRVVRQHARRADNTKTAKLLAITREGL